MTAPLTPITAVTPVALPVGQGVQAAGQVQAPVMAAAVQAAVPVLPAAPVVPSGQVQWSAQTLQNLKLQAFELLVAQLALQIQGNTGAQMPAWPSQGLVEGTQQLLQNLLAQILVNVQGQSQPLQLLAAQPGSVALMQALVQSQSQAQVQAQTSQSALSLPGTASTASGGSALQTAAALSSTAAAALEQAGHQPASSSALATRLPVLQNWWVQQGTLQTPQGERSFSLTLQVPVGWAQRVGGAQPAQTTPLRLSMPGMTALPASGPLALVLQPQAVMASGAQAGVLSTSALLWLELQPQTAAATVATTVLPAPAQEMQQLLQNKSDPWLMMAAAQAANALPVARRHGEHRSHFCSTEGCQYQGVAPCAQPFCSEMNRIWATKRTDHS